MYASLANYLVHCNVMYFLNFVVPSMEVKNGIWETVAFSLYCVQPLLKEGLEISY